jgi:succinyl-diaminopimelate desuccinylase
MDSLVDTLAWLVDIPSPTGQEEAICRAISDRLSTHPARVIQQSVVVGDPAPGKVLLVGHMDTVPLQGETGVRIDSDRLYGLGATDMKGGVAVMIHLVEALGTEGLVGVFYAGEEGPIVENQLGPILDTVHGLTEARAGIVLEPSNRELQSGCNGVINATVSFIGEPAHSARPWLGVNAVTKAGPFLTEIGRREPEDREIGGLVFREVMSVTRASGGIANNVVPGRFDLNINYRFAPDRSLDEAELVLRQVCDQADAVDITDRAPAAMPEVDNPLFDTLMKASGAPVTVKQGWTDVAQLAARGIPAVNFGPGETDLAHKPGESVRIDDLTWAFESLRAVLS